MKKKALSGPNGTRHPPPGDRIDFTIYNNAMNVNRGTGKQQKLPSGWRWVELGEVCYFRHGGTPSKTNPNYWSGTIPWVSPKDMKTDLIWDTEDHITQDAINQSSACLVPAGAILIVVRSGILAHHFPVALTGQALSFNQDIKALLPKGAVVNPNFLFHILRAQESTILSDGIKKGATVHSVRSAYIEKLEIPLPPLAEQKRIAAILNEQMAAVEKARAAAETQLEAATALPAGYLRQVFPKEGQELPFGWRWAKLGDLCDSQIANKDPREAPEAKFNYVDISSIDNQQKRILEAKKLLCKEAPSRARQVIKEKDIIVSTTRPGLNAVAIISPELEGQICSTGFCVLRTRPDILIPELLFFFVQTSHFVSSLKNLVRGALYPAVTDSQVRDQLFPLPPLVEQKRISAVLGDQMASAKRLRNDLEKQLHEINSLSAALLRRAFNGEL